MTEGGTARRRVIDADVHCAVPNVTALKPYLDGHWAEELDVMKFTAPPSCGVAYPDWIDMVRTRGAELTLERLQREVLQGVECAVLHCYYAVESFTHPYLARTLATAVNRWLQTEWLDRDERLRATAVVTPQFPTAASEEIERIAEDPRFVQIMLPARAQHGYGHEMYLPIFEAAARHRLPVAICPGGGTGGPPTPVNWMDSYFEDYVLATLPHQSHIMSLVLSGVFERWPELMVVISESGWTWLPYALWHFDQEWKASAREVPWVKEPPSHIVQRHFRLTTQPIDRPSSPGQLAQVLAQMSFGSMLLYSSDFPHRYPTQIEEVLQHLPAEQHEQVLWRNAAELYALPVG